MEYARNGSSYFPKTAIYIMILCIQGAGDLHPVSGVWAEIHDHDKENMEPAYCAQPEPLQQSKRYNVQQKVVWHT